MGFQIPEAHLLRISPQGQVYWKINCEVMKWGVLISMFWHRSLWQRHSKGHVYLKIICCFKCHQILGQFPLGSSPEICSRFILLNLKGGLFFRRLKQNRNVFQINIQRLESVRQSGKEMVHLSFEETGLLMMVPFVLKTILHMHRTRDSVGAAYRSLR